jgi:hypothetical protein
MAGKDTEIKEEKAGQRTYLLLSHGTKLEKDPAQFATSETCEKSHSMLMLGTK